MLVVCVEFEVALDRLTVFLPLMIANARDSLAHEVGCHQFDVVQDPDAPHKITLYELYDDVAAFEIHKQAAHYMDFVAATHGMIIGKEVRLLNRIYPQDAG